MEDEDIIEKVTEEARKNKVLCADTIEDEIKRTKEYEEMLDYKLQQIEMARLSKAQIPKHFKKVEDIIKEERDLKKFYYNLLYYGFVIYSDGVGFLVRDNKNFYLKITTYVDGFPVFDDYQEELYITEETAYEVLKYDDIVDEMKKQAMEESE